jgi:hypothetical protein
MVSAEGGPNVEDPATFFANVFGGERFMDYVRGVCVCGPPALSRATFLIQNEVLICSLCPMIDRRNLVDEGHDQRREYNHDR